MSKQQRWHFLSFESRSNEGVRIHTHVADRPLTPGGGVPRPGRFICTHVDPDDAPLIAAAPEMLDALKAQHKAIDTLFAMLIERDASFFPTKSGSIWAACLAGNAAIEKAEGKKL